MARNFSKQILVDGVRMLATILPQLRKDGMYYEVNIKNYPRFYMAWSALGRYDAVPETDVTAPPYEVVLAVSDVIEEGTKKG